MLYRQQQILEIFQVKDLCDVWYGFPVEASNYVGWKAILELGPASELNPTWNYCHASTCKEKAMVVLC